MRKTATILNTSAALVREEQPNNVADRVLQKITRWFEVKSNPKFENHSPFYAQVAVSNFIVAG